MPNGFHGSPERWQRAIGPLEQIDEEWAAFAADHDLSITRNDRNWPERSLKWSDGLTRKIQLYLVDEQKLTFSLSVYAWQDEEHGRRGVHRKICQNVSWAEIQSHLRSLLSDAYELAASLRDEDLV